MTTQGDARQRVRRGVGRLRRGLGRVGRRVRALLGRRTSDARLRREVDTLYEILYRLMHDWDAALDLSSLQTRQAFARQWQELPAGKFLLSDPWFRERADRILSEEELLIRREWFAGRSVLDAGCGNGRWAYALARLGARVTAVDVNPVAVEATRKALEPFAVEKQFHVSPLEELSAHLPAVKFDLVLSWGVLHHCGSFTRALREVASFVADDGLLCIYLYDRASSPHEIELEVFKERLYFLTLDDPEARRRFLLQKAGGDPELVHGFHDAYAPLINRRMAFEPVRERLRELGFEHVELTRDVGGLMIRAMHRESPEFQEKWALPRPSGAYWFQRH